MKEPDHINKQMVSCATVDHYGDDASCSVEVFYACREIKFIRVSFKDVRDGLNVLNSVVVMFPISTDV